MRSFLDSNSWPILRWNDFELEQLVWKTENIPNWQLGKSNERKETEKKPTCVFKNLQLLKTDLCFQKKTDLCFQKSTTFEKSKKMTSKLFEFVEQFVVDTFMLK